MILAWVVYSFCLFYIIQCIFTSQLSQFFLYHVLHTIKKSRNICAFSFLLFFLPIRFFENRLASSYSLIFPTSYSISLILCPSPPLPSSFFYSPLSLQTYIYVDYNAIIIPEQDYGRIFLGSYTHGITELSASLPAMITFSRGIAFRSK